MRAWQSQSHVRWYGKYPIGFAPKYRRRVLYGQLRRRVGVIVRELCQHHARAASPRGGEGQGPSTSDTQPSSRVHHSTEESESVTARDFLDVRVRVAALNQTADNVFAVGWRLQAVEVGSRKLIWTTTQNDPVKVDMIAHTGIGANAHMVDADERLRAGHLVALALIVDCVEYGTILRVG